MKPIDPGSTLPAPSFDPYQQFMTVLENIPGVSFFAKSADGKIIAASHFMVKRFGRKSQDQLLGKTDFDFFPAHIAEGFLADDRLVMETGKPLINRVEVLFDENHILDWYSTNKFPLCDSTGKIIGVMGTTHSMEEQRGSVFSNVRISKAVQIIQTSYAEKLSIAGLAAHCSLSERQFRRRFQEIFEMSPQEFILKTRIQAACKMIKQGEQSIAEVALGCGFGDQSSFSHQFRKYLGITPMQFRKGTLKSSAIQAQQPAVR